MKLSEHNNEIITRFNHKDYANVECDKCGYPMYYTQPGIVLDSYPSKQEVKCLACGHTDYKLSL